MTQLNNNNIVSELGWTRIFTNLNLIDKLRKVETIVIKTNFASGSTADPKRHIVIDLEFLSDLIKNLCLINHNAILYIAEGDSTDYGFAFLKFEHLGLPGSLYLDESTLKRVQLLDLSRDELVRITDGRFLYFNSINRQLWLSKTLTRADFVISLTNLKTHSITGYTGACKNLFGCLPDTNKSIYHPFIHEVIHDLTLAISPSLSIVDAFYAMERNGPCQGDDIDLGFRLYSDDALEADIQALLSVGLNPLSIKYIKLLTLTNHFDFSAIVEATRNYELKIRKPQRFLRMMNSVGLTIQRFGQSIASFGHAIHTSNNLLVLMVTIIRPILIGLFGIDELKLIKKKFEKWYH